MDIQFAIKELSRDMATPKLSSWEAFVRLAKYLKKRPRYAIWFRYQAPSRVINTCVDSDWAGEAISRKSTSGGIISVRVEHTQKLVIDPKCDCAIKW